MECRDQPAWVLPGLNRGDQIPPQQLKKRLAELAQHIPRVWGRDTERRDALIELTVLSARLLREMEEWQASPLRPFSAAELAQIQLKLKPVSLEDALFDRLARLPDMIDQDTGDRRDFLYEVITVTAALVERSDLSGQK